MKNQHLTWTVLFALALAAGVYLTFFKPAENGSFYGPEGAFAVKPKAEIDRIFLADRDRNRIWLERQEGYWTVNNKYKARPDAIRHLLKAVTRVEVDYPVPEQHHDQAMRDLAGYGIKVQVYKKGQEEPAKTYYVGGAANNNEGTFMIMEGADQPFVTYIKGFRGYLTPRYFTDEEEWRSRVVFDYEPNEIKKVRINYPNAPEQSFTLEVTSRDSFRVTPLFREGDNPPGPLARTRVRNYLNNFERVGLEGYENSYVKKDAILALTPFAEVEITDKSGEQKRLIAYPKPVDRRSKMQFDRQGNPVKYDRDRLFALLNEGRDFAVIQFFVFGKIFRKYDDFFVRHEDVEQQPELPF